MSPKVPDRRRRPPGIRAGNGRSRLAWIAAAVIVAGVAVINVGVALNGSVSTGGSSATGAAASPPSGVLTYPEALRGHIEGNLSYDHSPPVGGNHSSVWQNCGVYDQPVRNENAVHSLEHGAVWVTYLPSLGAADVAALRRLVISKYDGSDRYVLLSPYPLQAAPVMAQAWGYQLSLTGASDARLSAFIDYFRQGPQDLERGAACSGGTGSPAG